MQHVQIAPLPCVLSNEPAKSEAALSTRNNSLHQTVFLRNTVCLCLSEVYWPVWCLYGHTFCRQVYLLCVSQLFKVGQCGALGLAGGASLTEVHLVLPLRRAQVEHSSCVG